MLLFDGHSDEVGFIVQSIDANGMLRILPVGGWVPQNVPAHPFMVRRRDGTYIRGISAAKPPHFMTEEEKNRTVRIEDILVDVGGRSEDDTLHVLGIAPGAPVVPEVGFEIDRERGVMTGKAFDNRLGCAAVLQTMKELASDDIAVRPVGVLSSQEEIGLRGARVTAARVSPAAAVVFEGTPADDSWSGGGAVQAAMGKGPQIRHWDSSMVPNPRFVAFARDVASSNGIPFQDAVRAHGGTDGGSIHLSASGIPTIVIGVPVRYAHSHYGKASVEDYLNAVRWGVEIARSLDPTVLAAF